MAASQCESTTILNWPKEEVTSSPAAGNWAAERPGIVFATNKPSRIERMTVGLLIKSALTSEMETILFLNERIVVARWFPCSVKRNGYRHAKLRSDRQEM